MHKIKLEMHVGPIKGSDKACVRRAIRELCELVKLVLDKLLS